MLGLGFLVVMVVRLDSGSGRIRIFWKKDWVNLWCGSFGIWWLRLWIWCVVFVVKIILIVFFIPGLFM